MKAVLILVFIKIASWLLGSTNGARAIHLYPNLPQWQDALCIGRSAQICMFTEIS